MINFYVYLEKIFEYILIGLSLIPFLYLMFNFINSDFKHRKTMNNIEKWKRFNEQTIIWGNQIQNLEIKDKFFKNCYSIISMSLKDIKTFNHDKEMDRIISNYGHHIPEFMPKIRDEKIDSILNE